MKTAVGLTLMLLLTFNTCIPIKLSEYLVTQARQPLQLISASDNPSGTDEGTICKPTLTTVIGPTAPSEDLCQNQLIFNEEFNTFNTSVWEREQDIFGINKDEFQWYTDSNRNSFVTDDRLHIRPTLTTDEIDDINICYILMPGCEDIDGEEYYDGIDDVPATCKHTCSVSYPAPPVQSAYLTTQNSFGFKYGRLEVRAKTPTGDWLWPSIRLIPMFEKYGAFPRSGEILLMESRGNAKYTRYFNGHIGVEQVHSALRFDRIKDTKETNFYANSPKKQGFNAIFHNYQLEWTPSHIKFSVDDKVIGLVETNDGHFYRTANTVNIWEEGNLDAPFDQEFSLAIGLAVGGSSGYFPDIGTSSMPSKPWINRDEFAMRDFWNGRDLWLPTWNFGSIEYTDSEEWSEELYDTRRELSFQIEHIRIYAL